MDSEKDIEKRIREIVAKNQANPEDVSWDEMREVVKLINEKTLSMFDVMIKSRWNRGNQKFNLKVFHALMQMNGKTTEDMMTVFEYIHDLTKAIYLLNSKLEKNSEVTTIVETTLGKLEAKLASPTIERVAEYLDLVEKQYAKKNKVRDKYTV